MGRTQGHMERTNFMGRVAPQYVCVHVPEFPAQARLRLRPDLAKTAVAILEGEPPLQEVCSATRAARRLGVTNAMTRAQLDAFPALTVLPRSVSEEKAARLAVLHMAAGFTPRTEFVGAEGRLVPVMDMSGTGLIFGDASRCMATVAKAVGTLGLTAQYAVSANFHAAVCAAAFASRDGSILPAGQEPQCLGSLPVAALPLSAERAATLELWGIRTLAELAALPEVELVARLGQEGKRLRSMALGEWPHLLVPEEAAILLEEFVEFDAPENRLEALLFVAGPMLDQLIARVQRHALSLASLTITLLLDGGGEHVRVLKPALPLADRAVLLKLMHLDLQTHPPSAEVMGLRIGAEPGKRGKVQMGLFSPQLPEPTRLEVTLAQIEAMVGEGRVGSPRLLDTHRPDSFTIERFVPPTKIPEPSKRQLSTAVRRVRPPLGVRVWLDAPTRRPKSLVFESKHYSVVEAYGPWRRSGEWWSERVWSREEWDVRAAFGASSLLCVLAHDLLREFWQIEAFYD